MDYRINLIILRSLEATGQILYSITLTEFPDSSIFFLVELGPK